MKLSLAAISKMTESTKEAMALRSTLAIALGRSEEAIRRNIRDNTDNNLLTTFKALQVISKSTGLKTSQILEESEPARV